MSAVTTDQAMSQVLSQPPAWMLPLCHPWNRNLAGVVTVRAGRTAWWIATNGHAFVAIKRRVAKQTASSIVNRVISDFLAVPLNQEFRRRDFRCRSRQMDFIRVLGMVVNAAVVRRYLRHCPAHGMHGVTADDTLLLGGDGWRVGVVRVDERTQPREWVAALPEVKPR